MPSRRAALLGALLCLLQPFRAAAGPLQALGREFWAADLDNHLQAADAPFGFVVFNPGAVAAEVAVSGDTGELARTTVPPGGSMHVPLSRARRLDGTALAPHAMRIVSTEPVAVTQHNPLGAPAYYGDGTRLLPVESLGTVHRAISHPQDGIGPEDDLPGLIAVVNAGPSTVSVVIIPEAPVRDGDLPRSPAGVPLELELRSFEALQLATENLPGADLTGSLVLSSAPVAVFGGHLCAHRPAHVYACEHLEEQVPPLEAWGREATVAPSPPRDTEPDTWRVLAGRPGTTVTFAPDVHGGGPVTLAQAGDVVEVTTPDAFRVTSDGPVLLAHETAGGDVGRDGDPSLTLAVPDRDRARRHDVHGLPGYASTAATIVAPPGATVTIDSVPLLPRDFTLIGATGFSYAVMPLSPGAHLVDGDAPLSVETFSRDVASALGIGSAAGAAAATVSCEPGGPYSVTCAENEVALDAGASAGAVAWTWEALTGGITLADPAAPATTALLAGAGPWAVLLTVRDAAGAESACAVPITVRPLTSPVVECAAEITSPPTEPGAAEVVVRARSPACSGAAIVNDRTAGGADATDRYPCGTTLVTFTAADDAGATATCVTRVTVADASAPPEIASPGEPPLRVARDAAGDVRVTFPDPGRPELAFQILRGTILPEGLVTYDHAPVACHQAPRPVTGGRLELTAPREDGASRYYLVTASSCAGEGSAGSASDGRPRAGSGSCGPVR